MSFPEYRQQPEDHSSCIILVRPIGRFLSKESFTQLWEHLNKLETVSVSKDGRALSVRFLLNYPVENNEWGDFQYHRKVLGLICIAQYNENVAGFDLERHYTDLKNLYESTLLDSRLIILGLPRINSQPVVHDSKSTSGSTSNNELLIEPNHYDHQPNRLNGAANALSDSNGLKQLADNISDTTRHGILSYLERDEALSHLHTDLEYMCQSLFYVLDGKRLSATNPPPILTAPFEKPGDNLNTDLESK